MPFSSALIGRKCADKHHSRVGRPARKRETHDGEGPGDVVICGKDGLRALGQICCIGQRRTRRRLHNHHQEFLVFLRDEAGGDMLIHPNRGAQAGEEYQQEQVAKSKRHMDAFGISTPQPAHGCIRPMHKAGKCARDRPDVKKVELFGPVLFAAQEQCRQGRRKGQRVESRNSDGEGNGERELAIEDSRRSGEEGYRDKHGDKHQGRGNDGTGDLAHGV